MTKITVQGGFHGASPITLNIRDDKMSVGQYKRLDKHMCGIQGCVCGWRGFEVEGVSGARFTDMLRDADYVSRSGPRY